MVSKRTHRVLHNDGTLGAISTPPLKEKIFQRFDLNLVTMVRLSDEERTKLNLPEAGKTLRRELLEKGYGVLESNTAYCGVSESIIVAGEIGMNHKGDFYELAERLGLRFKSGDYYTQGNGKD